MPTYSIQFPTKGLAQFTVIEEDSEYVKICISSGEETLINNIIRNGKQALLDDPRTQPYLEVHDIFAGREKGRYEKIGGTYKFIFE
ncbi:hypothetical protein C9426_25200 [Serratia sp. S1B]|nr:hypothetical protein C9426_25200 [Serratia sp. S1B]